MPVIESSAPEAEKENFHDLRHGKTFIRTKDKFGKQRAQKQMVAIVLSTARKADQKKDRKRG